MFYRTWPQPPDGVIPPKVGIHVHSR